MTAEHDDTRPAATAWDKNAVPAGEYERIAQALTSNESPVGIDAKHTHVLILHALHRIEQRLDALERRIGEREEGAEARAPRA
jgi:hypothetical protein